MRTKAHAGRYAVPIDDGALGTNDSAAAGPERTYPKVKVNWECSHILYTKPSADSLLAL